MQAPDWRGALGFAHLELTFQKAGDEHGEDVQWVTERLFDEHRRGVANHGRLLYAIAMFSCWWSDQRQQRVPTPVPRAVRSVANA